MIEYTEKAMALSHSATRGLTGRSVPVVGVGAVGGHELVDQRRLPHAGGAQQCDPVAAGGRGRLGGGGRTVRRRRRRGAAPHL